MTWTESDSALYQALAAVAVPDRAEQLAAVLALLPFDADQPARVVELGCGEGRLTQAVLEAFPRATALVLDGSSEMRAEAAARLKPLGARAKIGAFELDNSDWWSLVDGANAVVSSLAIHHLDGPVWSANDGGAAHRVQELAPLVAAAGFADVQTGYTRFSQLGFVAARVATSG